MDKKIKFGSLSLNQRRNNLENPTDEQEKKLKQRGEKERNLIKNSR